MQRLTQNEWFQKMGFDPPTRQGHGTTSEIRDNLVNLKPHSWYMEGNKLIGQTEMGPLTQFLPTDYICRGTDNQGLPILEKVVL